MKKIFGGINLSWVKVIVSAIVIGIVVGLMNSVPVLKDSSLTDSAIYFDVWILFGILIIMNSKSNKDSALKCFIFFLISQPLIYLVEVPFSYRGWSLFVYYKYWFIWTIMCLPMGYIGYYIKKDKWWGLLILLPIMFMIAMDVSVYLSQTIFSFPRHLLSYIFSVCSLIIYPLYLFNNKKIKITGLIIGLLGIIVFTTLTLINRPVYETEVLCSNDTISFDNTYKTYLTDDKYGSASIIEIASIEDYCIHTKFTKAGKTELVLESNDGDKKVFDLIIKRDTYDIERKQ